MPNRKSHTSTVPSGNRTSREQHDTQKPLATSRKREEGNVNDSSPRNKNLPPKQVTKKNLTGSQADRGNLE